MISKELVRMMAEESPEMAVWASIIRWYGLKSMTCLEVKSSMSFELWSELCGLCRRYLHLALNCQGCPLAIADAPCSNSGSMYNKAKDALGSGDNESWKNYSTKVFELLCSIIAAKPLPQDAKEEKVVTYKRGDHFLNGVNDEYVLSVLMGMEMALICIKDGLRWVDGMGVNNTLKVTQEEFSKMSYGSTFTLIEDKRGCLPIGEGW